MKYVAFALFFALAGCGANGPLGLNPQPNGNITLSNPPSTAVFTTSAANPFVVTGGAFVLGIQEDHFSGPYTVTVITWTAPFNIPCYVPHYIDSTNAVNSVRFQPDNGAPITSPNQLNPCIAGDSEVASINDRRGHIVYFYYTLQ